MSPWPTNPDFMNKLVGDFRRVAEAGVARCVGTEPLMKNFRPRNVRVVVRESLSWAALDRDAYPDRMPFYLHGGRAEAHLDHVLKTAPNAQICAERVRWTCSRGWARSC